MNKAISPGRHDAAVRCDDHRVLVLGDQRPRDVGKYRVDMEHLRPDKRRQCDIEFLVPQPAAGKRQPAAFPYLFEHDPPEGVRTGLWEIWE